MKPSRPRKKYHPIDFVPKRKGAEEIQSEIQRELNRPLVAPGKKGTNRKEIITDLQERFQFKDKAEIDAYMLQQKQASLLPELNQPGKKKRKWNTGIA